MKLAQGSVEFLPQVGKCNFKVVVMVMIVLI